MFLPVKTSEEISNCHQEILRTVDKDDLDTAIKKCVQAIIILGQHQKPIKRTELCKVSFSQNNIKNNRHYSLLIQVANIKLYKMCGLRLFELGDKTRFILVNATSDFAQIHKHSRTSSKEFAIIYMVLVEIFASHDEKIHCDEVKNSLCPLNLQEDDVKRIMSDAVQRMYLAEKRIEDNRYYTWGPRAHAEVEPDSFFNSFKELISDHPSAQVYLAEFERRIEKLKLMPNRYPPSEAQARAVED